MTKRIVGLSAAVVLFMSIAAAQPAAKPLPPPPAGFKALADSPSTVAMRKAGVMDMIDSEKPNEGWPNCYIDPKIHFMYSWTTSPMGDKAVEMMAQGPEDPAARTGGSLDERAGKKRYRNGVLKWRKVTTTSVGTSPNCRETVTYTGQWAGFVSGKLIGVGVSNLYRSMEPGQAWIDEYIDKMIAAVK
jgi:hypothetical protein